MSLRNIEFIGQIFQKKEKNSSSSLWWLPKVDNVRRDIKSVWNSAIHNEIIY